MRVILRQSLPLGRFHATPWRANSFDDPFGEWPPSPWRLVRAICARWYQWRREIGEYEIADLENLLSTLCRSSYAFRLPAIAHRDFALRQYQPAQFGWHPAERKKAGIRNYGTTLVQDNAWCVAADESDDAAIWWLIDGDKWTPRMLNTLDACLARILYFGRAESITTLRRCAEDVRIQSNCALLEEANSSRSAPVLIPTGEATREDIERITDDIRAKSRTVPPGATWVYADLPAPIRQRELPARRAASLLTHVIQFAVGFAVPPDPRALARLTSAFRSRVLTAFVRIRTGNRKTTWSTAPQWARSDASLLSGKDAEGHPLQGKHRHAAFLGWVDEGAITRLLVWRQLDLPFSDEERAAILQAAERELSWAASGQQVDDDWRARLVPLDRSVAHPPGFNEMPAQYWQSATPYVPPRHHLRNGKPRPNESVASQIRRELGLREIPGAENATIRQIGNPTWMSVHVSARERKQQTSKSRRLGYQLVIEFPNPITGPLMLGHSSHFGLGLFLPATGA